MSSAHNDRVTLDLILLIEVTQGVITYSASLDERCIASNLLLTSTPSTTDRNLITEAHQGLTQYIDWQTQ